jgi:hypothetical protein
MPERFPVAVTGTRQSSLATALLYGMVEDAAHAAEQSPARRIGQIARFGGLFKTLVLNIHHRRSQACGPRVFNNPLGMGMRTSQRARSTRQ